MKSKSHRSDIQALRGIAVLLVLFYHAKIGGLAAGYLGVDIFYVISGYLITGLIARQIDVNSFSFVPFYISRARRLLPAAYVVYLATAIGAYFLLTSVEYDRFQGTLIGAITFTANIDLWQNTNYFSPAAKFNPLTHTWSLSIEEQYYLLLPFVLFFVPRRFWIAGTLFVLAASSLLCLYLSSVSPAAAFYLLPTRAWELAVGSLIALTGYQISQTRVAYAPIKYLALACLILVPAFAPGVAMGSLHPGLDSIIVSLATGFLLIARASFLETGQIAKLLSKIGDISYSLYLVHWPLFAFAYNTYLGETPPVEVRLILLIVSLILAYGLFRLVESPTRRMEINLPVRALFAVIVASIAIVTLSYSLQEVRSLGKNYPEIRARNQGFGNICDQKDVFSGEMECANSATPNMLVWGDSFAMHLIPGIASTDGSAVIQATRSSCGPILGIAAFRPHLKLNENWAKSCLAFNQSVHKYLADNSSIKTVVLSSPFHYYIQPKAHGLRLLNSKPVPVIFEESMIKDELVKTIIRVRALGKRVVVIGPTPTTGYNIGLCLERLDAGLPIFGPNKNCLVKKSDYLVYRNKEHSMIKHVSIETGGGILELGDVICFEGNCPTRIGSTFLYSDRHHFTIEGSRAMAKKYNLVDHILAIAK